jgi:hypothetical protein
MTLDIDSICVCSNLSQVSFLLIDEASEFIQIFFPIV